MRNVFKKSVKTINLKKVRFPNTTNGTVMDELFGKNRNQTAENSGLGNVKK